MAISLNKAVACVTGGARGIGAATAKALARQGAIVVIGDLDLDLARETACKIGDNAIAVHLDVASIDSFTQFIAAARCHGPVDLLVNNAGIQRTGSFAEQSLASQHREIAINLGGVITGMNLVLPDMLSRNHGHIVNVSSMAGKMSVPGAAVYTASKFGVAGLSRAVRAEIMESHVTITTVLPSAVQTELTAGLNIRGVPTSTPDEIAAEIVRSCRQYEAEVSVPRWLFPIGAIEQALPERAGAWLKHLVGAQKRITASNETTCTYQERSSRS
jgi:short-subunit dehydrogenase